MNNNIDITKKMVVSAFIWKMLERLISQGIYLIVQIILARLILPTDFGYLAILVALTNYAAIFVQSGLSTVIIQKEGIGEEEISTLFTISIAIAAIFYIILYFCAPLISQYYKNDELIWALRVLALILFLNSINSIQTAILSREMKFKKLFARSIISILIAGSVGIIMAYLGYGIWALVIHNLLYMIVVVIILGFDKKLKFRLGFSFKKVKGLYKFSVKIIFTSLITGFYDLVRTVIIGKKYSSAKLAYYDKGYTYSSYTILLITASIQGVLLPVFSRKQCDLYELKKLAQRSFKLSSFITIPVLIAVTLLADKLVIILLTEKWKLAIPFLQLFCIMRIPGNIQYIDKQVYYAIGKSGINLLYEIGLFILNIIAIVITINSGIMAIAIGTTIIEYLGGLAFCLISAKEYGYSIKERYIDLKKTIASTIFMAICISSIGLINLNTSIMLIVQFLVGIISYLVFAIIIKDDNILYLKNIFNEYTR